MGTYSNKAFLQSNFSSIDTKYRSSNGRLFPMLKISYELHPATNDNNIKIGNFYIIFLSKSNTTDFPIYDNNNP
jgi:hypothetical protein